MWEAFFTLKNNTEAVMQYTDHKEQLIIRTRDEYEAEILRTLKALASLESITYSEMAMKCVKAGMIAEGHDLPSKGESLDTIMKRGDKISVEVKKQERSQMRLDIVQHLENDSSVEKAVNMLADFFGKASSEDVTIMKKDLKDQLDEDKYTNLMSRVKKKPQYRKAFKGKKEYDL